MKLETYKQEYLVEIIEKKYLIYFFILSTFKTIDPASLRISFTPLAYPRSQEYPRCEVWPAF